MECREVKERLSDFRRGVLSTGDGDRVGEHLKLCEDCAFYLQELTEIMEMLSPCRDGGEPSG